MGTTQPQHTSLLFPNDAISALDVGSAARAVLYQHSRFVRLVQAHFGFQAHFEGGAYYDDIGTANDETSSIQVFPNHGHLIAASYLGNYPRERHNYWAHEANGIAHDEESWFISQNEPARIWRIPFRADLNDPLPPPGARVTSLPQHLRVIGYNHVGDLDQSRGLLFVPVTGEGLPPLLAIYRASDLQFITVDSLRASGAGWVAINPATGELYTSASAVNAKTGVHVYTRHLKRVFSRFVLEFRFNRELFLSHRDGRPVDLRTMQGGTFSPDGSLLYLANGFSSEVRGDGEGLRVFDLQSGVLQAEAENKARYGPFTFEISSGCPHFQEAEGIDFVDVNDKGTPGIKGQLHVILLQNEKPRFIQSDAVFLKHYEFWPGLIQGRGSESVALLPAVDTAGPLPREVEQPEPGRLPRGDTKFLKYPASTVPCIP